MHQSDVCATLDTSRIGEVLLNAVATAQQMGHRSPVGSIPYIAANDRESAFVRDVLLACTPTGDARASERLLTLVDSLGLADKIAQAVTR